MAENSNANSNTNTPHLDKEFKQEDDKANDNQSGNPQRDTFKKIHEPRREDPPPLPDSGGPMRGPTDNPTDTSPNT